eukprot:GHVR01184088.1.p1 GENE.GHVR01184088.1~~GHVR01184088.1.p1  ORF type:complete len:385 (+),score=23.49 GHVR01184088.1:2-1156(+)
MKTTELAELIRNSESTGEVYEASGLTRNAVELRLRRAGLPPIGQMLGTKAKDQIARYRTREKARQQTTEAKRLLARVAELEALIGLTDSLPTAVPVIRPREVRKGSKRPGTVCTLISDLHDGEAVSAEETMGRNEYSAEIFESRMLKIWDNAIWCRREALQSVDSPDHFLWLGGDEISGSIHPELEATNDIPLVDQVFHCASHLLPGILRLADTLGKGGRLYVHCSHGNHGRITDKSRIKVGWANSLEYVLHRHLEKLTADDLRIVWCIPRAENHIAMVNGWRVQMQHGTHIRSAGGVGGIMVPLRRATMQMGTADYYIFGHFHQAHWYGQVITNGSLIGESAYTTAKMFASEPPQQTHFVVDQEHGVYKYSRLWCTSAGKGKK